MEYKNFECPCEPCNGILVETYKGLGLEKKVNIDTLMEEFVEKGSAIKMMMMFEYPQEIIDGYLKEMQIIAEQLMPRISFIKLNNQRMAEFINKLATIKE